MFDNQIRLSGMHADYMIKLTNAFEETKKIQTFNKNIDVLINAPLVGFLYNRKAEIDHSKDPNTNKEYDTSIFAETVLNYRSELIFNYQLIMLLDDDYEPNKDKRINKAFRQYENNKEDYERFQSYLRGGIEVLYEKLIKDAKDPIDYINHLYDFVADFDERFNGDINQDAILRETNG